jgi:release factor glutamine methyltransferase
MPETGAALEIALRRGVDRLRSQGIADARRQALSIWSELSGDPAPVSLLTDSQADPSVLARFEQAIERRAGGEPLAHVIGTVGFRHLTLRSDRRALIPRPETEGLVDLLMQRVHSGLVADVGTGSGCLALSLAQEGSFSLVVAIDRSEEAIALAGENLLTVSSRATPVRLVRGDLCSPLRGGAFNAIVSNPPYLTHAEYAALDSSVRDWEPAQALNGGSDGLAITRELLEQAPAVLRQDGWMALEVDCSRAGLVAQAAVDLGWARVGIYKDLFGRERYVLAQRSNSR